jgi:hypothetical protein
MTRAVMAGIVGSAAAAAVAAAASSLQQYPRFRSRSFGQQRSSSTSVSPPSRRQPERLSTSSTRSRCHPRLPWPWPWPWHAAASPASPVAASRPTTTGDTAERTAVTSAAAPAERAFVSVERGGVCQLHERNPFPSPMSHSDRFRLTSALHSPKMAATAASETTALPTPASARLRHPHLGVTFITDKNRR